MEQKRLDIYSFKKGDVITRVEPILMSGEEGYKDYSLVGLEIIFMGIANASIYISRETDFFTKMFMGRENSVIQIPLELAEKGWSFYEVPSFLEGQKPLISSENILKKKLDQAIKTDNYEEAMRIRKELDKLRNKPEDGQD